MLTDDFMDGPQSCALQTAGPCKLLGLTSCYDLQTARQSASADNPSCPSRLGSGQKKAAKNRFLTASLFFLRSTPRGWSRHAHAFPLQISEMLMYSDSTVGSTQCLTANEGRNQRQVMRFPSLDEARTRAAGLRFETSGEFSAGFLSPNSSDEMISFTLPDIDFVPAVR